MHLDVGVKAHRVLDPVVIHSETSTLCHCGNDISTYIYSITYDITYNNDTNTVLRMCPCR